MFQVSRVTFNPEFQEFSDGVEDQAVSKFSLRQTPYLQALQKALWELLQASCSAPATVVALNSAWAVETVEPMAAATVIAS